MVFKIDVNIDSICMSVYSILGTLLFQNGLNNLKKSYGQAGKHMI